MADVRARGTSLCLDDKKRVPVRILVVYRSLFLLSSNLSTCDLDRAQVSAASLHNRSVYTSSCRMK